MLVGIKLRIQIACLQSSVLISRNLTNLFKSPSDLLLLQVFESLVAQAMDK